MKPSILIAGALALGLASAALAQPPADSDSGAHGGGRGAIRAACGADFQKYCPDAKPGPGGGLRDCIMKNRDSFSDSCKAALAQMRSHRQPAGEASPAPQ
jgi:hypothetical protein